MKLMELEKNYIDQRCGRCNKHIFIKGGIAYQVSDIAFDFEGYSHDIELTKHDCEEPK